MDIFSMQDGRTLFYRECLLVLVPLRIVEAEWLIDGGALVHELNGAAGVGRDVTDGQQTVR